MVADETEARARRAASLELQAALARQTEEIALREGEVERELAAAEPALLEAQVRAAMERKGAEPALLEAQVRGVMERKGAGPVQSWSWAAVKARGRSMHALPFLLCRPPCVASSGSTWTSCGLCLRRPRPSS